MKREVPAPGSLIIPASTLAEFIACALKSYGSIRSAAEGIGIPYSTLRGWLGDRFNVAPGRSSDAFHEHLAGLGRGIAAVNENVAALRAHLDEIERLTGRR
jgi:hypothetical protein